MLAAPLGVVLDDAIVILPISSGIDSGTRLPTGEEEQVVLPMTSNQRVPLRIYNSETLRSHPLS
jgi:hypothetical protein